MTGPIRVAVDALGGDRGPEEIIAGAVAARSAGIEPVLFGPAGLATHGLELVETTQEIAMDEKPADAVRGKPDSSLVAACRAVHEGAAEAVEQLEAALQDYDGTVVLVTHDRRFLERFGATRTISL